MARDTWPAMLMITSSPAPGSDSSVTGVCRLSRQRPTTFALSRAFVHAVLKVVTGLVGSCGCPVPAAKTNQSGLQSPNRRMYHAGMLSLSCLEIVIRYRRRRRSGTESPRQVPAADTFALVRSRRVVLLVPPPATDPAGTPSRLSTCHSPAAIALGSSLRCGGHRKQFSAFRRTLLYPPSRRYHIRARTPRGG